MSDKIRFMKRSDFLPFRASRARKLALTFDKADIASRGFRKHFLKDFFLINHEEAWVEVPINKDWLAAYRMVIQGGAAPVIAEMRVFPNEPNRDQGGRWSAEYLGIKAKVP